MPDGIMRQRNSVLAVAALAVTLCAAGAGAGGAVATAAAVRAAGHRIASAAGAGWSNAIEAPGSGGLNKGGDASIASVSCASPGNCSAGGDYADGADHTQALVLSERNGHWGSSAEVPGTAALNKGGDASITAVSCPKAGQCAAAGVYEDRLGHEQVFVVDERNGRWETAAEVPGTAALNKGGEDLIETVSCASAGNCSAGGGYSERNSYQAFVVSEQNGRWGSAAEVPGSAALNKGGDATINSVSCASAGNCSAAGSYLAHQSDRQALVVTERNGHWGPAIEAPGSASLNRGGNAQLWSVSCPSAGNCAAAGFYENGSAQTEALVLSAKNGRWGLAAEVPGSAALNVGGDARLSSVSCSVPGSCSAAGEYRALGGAEEALVVTERNGHWGPAIEAPGSGALNTGGVAEVQSVSCTAPGDCGAGGYYVGSAAAGEAFVLTETNGRWGAATELPGSATLNVGGTAQVASVSCAKAGACAAGGDYTDASHHLQALVASQS